ncbi:NADH:ubiquinone reductase (Na(+)-transporting) subunit F [Microbulbifer yueqingensis]|uniref:Na(+)-translocating NADH-quinone reductase subunit F n=1 Tax=Microbulbifer yueqingensis TaxID=658219 RepID=A0A1G8Y1S7_9GAMM|nr:NADH:ubiquinone reductase (Na(+)-transporting) subunit F [Microbulbifer yueqingensis]SDJ96752.1 NADH:ubiquinone oxidoreductase, Na(+)-translocating, F subunit [Microbulbifer yueqingensis]
MNFIKTAHKWLSLVIGLQLALWLASGLAFALLDSSVVSGRHLAERQPAQAIAPQQSLLSHAEIARRHTGGEIFSIRLQPGLDRPVYRLETAEGIELRDAGSGNALVIDAAAAAAIAARDYAGDDSLIGEPVMLESATMETRGHSGAIWRVDAADEFGTTLYVSARDGQVLERRNDTWRLFDIFWMLHIMDYTERQDFNNPFVIAFGIGALLMSISGCLLLFSSFSRHDFNLVALLSRGRRSKVAVTLLDRAAAPLRELALPSGANLFDGLAANGVQLPSNCGGGGSCGLCQVQMPADTPVTGSEKALLSPAELAAGYRLACQQRASGATRLVLDDAVLQAGQFDAQVVATRFLTPFIKELRLRPLGGRPFDFRAGSFVQVEIPPHQLRLADMAVEPHFRGDWDQWRDTPGGAHGEALRRSYSMANAPGEVMSGSDDGDSDIVLNVRIQPPPPGQPALPAGAGSSYMFHLQGGDRVQLSGPFGSFHARDGEREMILIGGGAGMAPLRSIIVDQLRNRRTRRPIRFWYGARSGREVFYDDLFDTLAAEHTNFSWHLGLSEPRPEDNWTGPTGYISDIAAEQYLRQHPDLGKCEFYLCGPPVMLKASIAMLTGLGVREEQISFDDFGC